jgi:hypothetical protein
VEPISDLTITCDCSHCCSTGSWPLLKEQPCLSAVCHPKAIQNDALWKLLMDAGENLFEGVKTCYMRCYNQRLELEDLTLQKNGRRRWRSSKKFTVPWLVLP